MHPEPENAPPAVRLAPGAKPPGTDVFLGLTRTARGLLSTESDATSVVVSLQNDAGLTATIRIETEGPGDYYVRDVTSNFPPGSMWIGSAKPQPI